MCKKFADVKRLEDVIMTFFCVCACVAHQYPGTVIDMLFYETRFPRVPEEVHVADAIKLIDVGCCTSTEMEEIAALVQGQLAPHVRRFVLFALPVCM